MALSGFIGRRGSDHGKDRSARSSYNKVWGQPGQALVPLAFSFSHSLAVLAGSETSVIIVTRRKQEATGLFYSLGLTLARSGRQEFAGGKCIVLRKED